MPYRYTNVNITQLTQVFIMRTHFVPSIVNFQILWHIQPFRTVSRERIPSNLNFKLKCPRIKNWTFLHRLFIFVYKLIGKIIISSWKCNENKRYESFYYFEFLNSSVFLFDRDLGRNLRFLGFLSLSSVTLV